MKTPPLRPSSRSELLARLAKLSAAVGSTRLYCRRIQGIEFCMKLEYANPTGSHKDRIALYMIRGAIAEGTLGPGGCVAEISSGNTAAAVAWAASYLGLRPLLFVEKRASEIKKSLIRSLGGEIVEIGDEGLTREWAREEAEKRGCYLLDQMDNEYNMLAHYESTGVEILRQSGGELDAFVMGVGTGGTITGVGRRLKEEIGGVLIAAVAPRGSPLAGGGEGEAEEIEGLVSRSVPGLVKRYGAVIDRVVGVSTGEAVDGVRGIMNTIGVPVGLSTGAAYAATMKLLEEGVIKQGDRVVTIAADSLARYPWLMRLLASGSR